MLQYLFTIKVKSGNRARALEVLASIQRQSRRDAGCAGFEWFQHADQPDQFTLLERWESEAVLGAHKAKGAAFWAEFEPLVASIAGPIWGVEKSGSTRAPNTLFGTGTLTDVRRPVNAPESRGKRSNQREVSMCKPN